MSATVTRRSVLLGGCVAVALAATPASASLLQPASMPVDGPAPRPTCPHDGCRFWRQGPSPAHGGLCGLARTGEIVVLEPDRH